MKDSSEGTKKWNAAILALIEAGSGDEIQLQAQNTERERGGMQNKWQTELMGPLIWLDGGVSSTTFIKMTYRTENA